MTEPTAPQVPTLAERALARLRKVAAGNGLKSADIVVYETQEKEITLKGKMDVSPLCETSAETYPGGVRGKGRTQVGTFAALQEAVAKHRSEFRGNTEWVHPVTEELRSHPGQGWGLESAKVTLPEKSAIYSATEICATCGGHKMLTCQQCLGKGTIICPQCQSRGRELCYYCSGRGEDPQKPGQPCHTCNGTRYAPCRFCQAHGYQACPACNGRRGTPCGGCQATGRITQEAVVTCGAETHFTMQTEGVPGNLRQGLGRLGIVNLPKGHADITATLPPKEGEEASEGKKLTTILLYSVVLPYAEMKISFGGKKGIVTALGKRCAISGVPNFLDSSLRPWLEKLRLAALGTAPLESALDARAIDEILSLTVAGKGQAKEVRRLYPFGLSAEVVSALLTYTRLALNKTTLKFRAATAVLCVALSAAFFYALFFEGIEWGVTLAWNRYAAFGFDLAALAAALGISWAVLNFTIRFILKGRFPKRTYALTQKIGKIGYGMFAGIAVAFVVVLFLAPVKPLWLVPVALKLLPPH